MVRKIPKKINVNDFITCRAVAWRRRNLSRQSEAAADAPGSDFEYRLYDYRRADRHAVDAVYDADMSGLGTE
jgi:hypothetical protein